MSRTIAVADIGGTNARFALAEIDGRRVCSVSKTSTFETSQYARFEDAWLAFARRNPGAEPNSIGLAFAGPVDGGSARLTNNAWSIDRCDLRAVGLDEVVIVNDFGAVAHAVATLGEEHFDPVCGPPGPLPRSGVTTVIGPGTGLGAAMVVHAEGEDRVVETEAGHIDFAPTCTAEDELLAALRRLYGRVSVERIASGPGLANIQAALSGVTDADHIALWKRALETDDADMHTLLDHWTAILGSFAGDLALAQGANAVVIAGGLGYRLRKILPNSSFPPRFSSKKPFEARLAAIPVRMLTYPEPGLLGAAVAFVRNV